MSDCPFSVHHKCGWRQWAAEWWRALAGGAVATAFIFVPITQLQNATHFLLAAHSTVAKDKRLVTLR